MTSGWRTEVIADDDALAKIEPDWWLLWRRSPGATPFSSPAWLIPWWTSFRPGQLSAVALWDGSRLAGLAPLWREEGPFGRRVVPLGIGLADYMDILVDEAEYQGTLPRLGRAVAELLDWESFDLEELADGAAGRLLPVPPGTDETVSDQSACPCLDLRAETPISGHGRRKLNLATNRVARRQGRVAAVAADEVPGFLDDLQRLHGLRWAGRGQAGVLADEAVQCFHRNALPRLAGHHLARLFTLQIGDAVVAAYYGLHHGHRAFAYLGGLDPAFAFESPGTVLLGHAIETARREGAVAFDFLRGQEPYKYKWGAVDRRSIRRTFRRSPRV